MYDISLPLIARISFSDIKNLSFSFILSSVRPSKVISPPSYFPGGVSTSLAMDMLEILFPQPDSPTSPSVSPFLT
jgi:hypothetical protein